MRKGNGETGRVGGVQESTGEGGDEGGRGRCYGRYRYEGRGEWGVVIGHQDRGYKWSDLSY